MTSILDAALAYAGRGWRVFPCDPHHEKPRAKRPLVTADTDEQGKAIKGSGWPAKASADERRIQSWWAKWPDALIGMSPGGAGAIVIDLDSKGEDVEAVRGRLEEAIGAPLPRCPTTRTQSGGLHLWFRKPDGAEFGNHSLGLKNIDIRADGGYVIMAPSVMRNGNAYVWLDGWEFGPDAPEVPAAIVAMIEARKNHQEPQAEAVAPAPPRPRHADGTPAEKARRRYALAALDAIATDAATAPKGERGTKLYAAAAAAGRLVGAGELSEREALAALTDAADACGLTKDDGSASVQREIRNGLSTGRQDCGAVKDRLDQIGREADDKAARSFHRPPAATSEDDYGEVRTVADDADHSPAPSALGNVKPSQMGQFASDEPGGAGGELDLDLSLFPLTDLGNAERFARRWNGRLIYVPALGWLTWTGQRWARDGADEVVTRAVHETVRAIQSEAKALADSDLDIIISTDPKTGEVEMLSDKVRKWGRSSEAASKLKPIPVQASPYLSVATEKLDADPWKINVGNGTLVIRRGAGDGDPISLKRHDPGDFITKLAPVIYDPNAECPIYDQFLAHVQPSDKMRRFLHQWGGYSGTGDVGEQKLVFFYGKGKNGKSTLVDAWGVVWGDYGETVPIETFIDQGRGRNAGAATPDLAILPGIRFLRTSEPEKGAKLAEALIKLVTGGEPIQARHLNRDYFKFRPKFKLTMSGNYRPQIDGTDEGIWRRLVLVPWLVKVEVPDKMLPFKLIGEASGILNRLLDGLRDYLDNGMVWPDEVIQATEQYREDSDPLGKFLADAVRVVPGERTQVTVLHRVFSAWAKANGEKEWTAKGLSMALKERGFRSKQSNVMWWIDVHLIRFEGDYERMPDDEYP